MKTLVHVFLRDYPRSEATFELWRRSLMELVRRQRLRGSGLFLHVAKRIDNYHLLHQDGPRHIANELLASQSQRDVLAEAGLVGELEHSTFMKAVIEEYLRSLSQRLARNEVAATRLTALLGQVGSGGKLRFLDHAPLAAEALLLPFARGGPTEVSVKDILRDFLLDVLGDPRIRLNEWHGVPLPAKDVMLKWLVGAALDDFFRVIDKTAQDAQWRVRKKFWSWYYENNLIDGAWVVLGTDGRYLLGDSGLARGYGRLRATSASHAVLLFRIRDLVVVEWSHAGACRIFDIGARGCPQLYQSSYERTALLSDNCERFVHRLTVNLDWRADVSRFIRVRTGAPIPPFRQWPRGGRNR